jgi:hypothetical protein
MEEKKEEKVEEKSQIKIKLFRKLNRIEYEAVGLKPKEELQLIAGALQNLIEKIDDGSIVKPSLVKPH